MSEADTRGGGSQNSAKSEAVTTASAHTASLSEWLLTTLRIAVAQIPLQPQQIASAQNVAQLARAGGFVNQFHGPAGSPTNQAVLA